MTLLYCAQGLGGLSPCPLLAPTSGGQEKGSAREGRDS